MAVLAAKSGTSAALRGVLAAQETHGNSRGLEGHLGGVCTIHEKFLCSRIA